MQTPEKNNSRKKTFTLQIPDNINVATGQTNQAILSTIQGWAGELLDLTCEVDRTAFYLLKRMIDEPLAAERKKLLDMNGYLQAVSLFLEELRVSLKADNLTIN